MLSCQLCDVLQIVYFSVVSFAHANLGEYKDLDLDFWVEFWLVGLMGCWRAGLSVFNGLKTELIDSIGSHLG